VISLGNTDNKGNALRNMRLSVAPGPSPQDQGNCFGYTRGHDENYRWHVLSLWKIPTNKKQFRTSARTSHLRRSKPNAIHAILLTEYYLNMLFGSDETA
jgi:hypothetical protein